MENKRFSQTIIILMAIIFLIAAGLFDYFSSQKSSPPIVENSQQELTYKNDEYGFQLTLPYSWQGYSAFRDSWEGTILDSSATKYQGPKIILRNPNWIETNPWQDIPVMVFTKDEWKLIEAENLGISAAPIGPSKLSENINYVFALPPRWVGFTDALGQDEAIKIIETFEAFNSF